MLYCVRHLGWTRGSCLPGSEFEDACCKKGGMTVARVVADPERYQSFLLRLWKETPELPWRYQVHCVSTGDEYRFSELDQVIAFLQGAAGGREMTGSTAPAG